MSACPWTAEEMARMVAADLEDGSYVNLGIGLPTLVAQHVAAGREIFFHCENGLIGTGPACGAGGGEANVIDAGSARVTLVPGAAVVGHDLSFAIARGGHLDRTILGAFQISESGDLSNWSTLSRPAGMGGAMDLATGARSVWVMTNHTANDRPKIVRECDLPLTAKGCVDRIYTDLAVIDVTTRGLAVRDMAPGVTPEFLRSVTEPPLLFPLQVRV